MLRREQNRSENPDKIAYTGNFDTFFKADLSFVLKKSYLVSALALSVRELQLCVSAVASHSYELSIGCRAKALSASEIVYSFKQIGLTLGVIAVEDVHAFIEGYFCPLDIAVILIGYFFTIHNVKRKMQNAECKFGLWRFYLSKFVYFSPPWRIAYIFLFFVKLFFL